MPVPHPASSMSLQQPRKLTALERNKLEWETHKNEIEQIYMDLDKTLEETMLFFKAKRGLDWSKRYWKVKLKEWKFEKNVPAKEMGFMAAKARKRELENGKETAFYRNGILVDPSKVQNKKQKLNIDDVKKIMVPETPHHVSYETPKPSFGQENDGAFPSPEAEISELDSFTGELGLEDHFGNEDQPVTATSRDNLDGAEGPPTTILDQIEVMDLTSDSEKSSGDLIAQTQICPQGEVVSAVDSVLMPGLLGEDVSTAWQLRRDGQISTATQHYFKAIRNFIDEGGEKSGQMIVVLVPELVQCLENVEPSDVPALASNCMDLLCSLHKMFSLTSKTHCSVSSALERLLVAHPEMPQGLDFHPISLALSEEDMSTPLLNALRELLARMRNALLFMDFRDENGFRIWLLSFACNLTLCLKKNSWASGFSALKTTVRKLSGMVRLLDNLFHPVGHWEYFVANLDHALNSVLDFPELGSKLYVLVEPPITELANEFSLNGWSHEAELLFTILRSTQSSKIVSKFRWFKISIKYLLHLERERKYQKFQDLPLLLNKDFMSPHSVGVRSFREISNHENMVENLTKT